MAILRHLGTMTIPNKRIAVPLVRQAYDYSCGPAALASCLYYWGVWDGREPELYSLLNTDEEGTSGYDIMSVAISFGLQVVYKKGLILDDLEQYLNDGYTCILNIQAWGDFGPGTDFETVWEDGHYIVLTNLINDDVEYMDPSVPGQYVRLSRSKFEARWHDWSDDGETKEYHTAIMLKGDKAVDLTLPYRI